MRHGRVDFVVCPSCLYDFESRERMIRHLQYNGSLLCRKFVLQNCAPISQADFSAVENDSKIYQKYLKNVGKDRHFLRT